MKKLILIIFSLVFSTIAHANDAGIKEFRDWLIKNDQTGYGFFKEVDICKEYKKHSKKWYESRCEAYPQGKKELVTNLDIKFYDGWIPEENVKPNYDTLVYEVNKCV